MKNKGFISVFDMWVKKCFITVFAFCQWWLVQHRCGRNTPQKCSEFSKHDRSTRYPRNQKGIPSTRLAKEDSIGITVALQDIPFDASFVVSDSRFTTITFCNIKTFQNTLRLAVMVRGHGKEMLGL